MWMAPEEEQSLLEISATPNWGSRSLCVPPDRWILLRPVGIIYFSRLSEIEWSNLCKILCTDNHVSAISLTYFFGSHMSVKRRIQTVGNFIACIFNGFISGFKFAICWHVSVTFSGNDMCICSRCRICLSRIQMWKVFLCSQLSKLAEFVAPLRRCRNALFPTEGWWAVKYFATSYFVLVGVKLQSNICTATSPCNKFFIMHMHHHHRGNSLGPPFCGPVFWSFPST